MSIKRTKPKVDRRASAKGLGVGLASATKKKKEPSWEEAMADTSEAEFVKYSVGGHFTEGTLLTHPKFGKGLVLSVEEKKMEVLFAESKKRLVMDTVLHPRPKAET
jgi:hypothetical protein